MWKLSTFVLNSLLFVTVSLTSAIDLAAARVLLPTSSRLDRKKVILDKVDLKYQK